MIRALLAIAIMLLPGVARATVIFSDDFNRPDNLMVGNGWAEWEDTPFEDAQILGNELELSDASATLHLSFAGFAGASVAFDWIATINGPNKFDFWYSLDDVAYTKLLSRPLSVVAALERITVALPGSTDNQPDVYLRWRSDTMSHIDNVEIDPEGVPTPGTLPLLFTGLVMMFCFATRGLWQARRRKA